MVTRSSLGATLGLKIEHIAEGRHNRPGTPMTPKRITIHNTDNSSVGADAEAHSRFVRNTGFYIHKGQKRWISWHYTVDDDSCIRHLPLNEVGWHAGSATGNATSIGIEICMNKGQDQNQAFDRAQRLIACLCYDLRLDVDDAVVPHMHWSGKKCPSLLLNGGELGEKWSNFTDGIKEYVNMIDDVDGV
jgi:N-acetylmuramoyl-L-alanine amidase